MLQVSAIVLLTISIIANVCANACGHDNCETTIDIPLITKLNAPLKAELDITSLTSQLKELIGKEVKQAVSNVMNDLVENITDMRFQIAVDRLQNFSNIAMSTFRTEIEAELGVKMEKKHTILDKKLAGEMAQLKSQFKTANEKVALTTCLSSSIQTSSNDVMKFPDVKTFEGINNIPAFKTTGLFTCEQAGLYLISVTIDTHTSGVFSIYHNSAFIIQAYTYNKVGNTEADHISTAVSAVVLNVGDTISVRTEGALYVHAYYTCMTIIKIK